MSDYIEIKGARLHNLKNIDVRIPRHKLVVITGPSGSGKSSLAFDTLYAEGQRRYVESLSAYARQFLEKMPKPEVDFISGINPAIAIQQKAPSGNPRSTVGTVTEIYDYLRLLFARVGDVYCSNCQQLIKKNLPADVLNVIKSLVEGTPFYLCYPLVGVKSQLTDQLVQLILSKGFLRIWHQQKVIDLRYKLQEKLADQLYVIVDRGIKKTRMDTSRLLDSIETAFREGEGNMSLISGNDRINNFTQNFVCSRCGNQMIDPQPRLFSFNNPFGACPGCQGFGDMMDWDIHKIIPNPKKTLRDGAIVPWSMPSYRHMLAKLAMIAPRHGFSLDQTFDELNEQQKNLIFNGSSDFIGIRGFFNWLETKKYKLHIRVFMSRFRGYFTCTRCHGQRLRPEALAITINQKNISDLTKMNISEISQFFNELNLPAHKRKIAAQLLKEINNRLQYLIDVGLSYLHLDRRASTLSGGEFQRINLATALGTALTETLYILDEPTIGLHPRDTQRLLRILKSLSHIGNTTVVVEHDKTIIENSDYIVDLGPAAGQAGGKVMYEGNYQDFTNFSDSLTSQYLRGEKFFPCKEKWNKGTGSAIHILGACEHNLKNIDVRIPLGMMVVITGVSGSGKSTLVHDVLYQGYLNTHGENRGKISKFDEIKGLKNIQQMELVDQSPIGRTPRSNPVTYIKAFEEIRKLFASLAPAKARGFQPGSFSFNVPGGRCENCEGDGQLKIDMQFLADVYIECDICKGKRYKQEILNIYFRGKNISNILELTINEALDFFSDYPKITAKIRVLQEVGLGYLKLGQPATTLSGGEAQRIKLAAHLARQTQRDVLFIFDEPTTGLHFDDIAKLMKALDTLIKRGASVLVIEHHLEVIRHADWIIDLGPEGGQEGGYIVAEGTPIDIAKNKNSYTGKYLKSVLSN
jgi:excinuclease ABC subunit A